MKLTVLGATGATGEQIVRQALAAGHDVTAMARRAEAIPFANTKLRVVHGDAMDSASLRDAVVGADAVLSALGSREMNRPTTVYSAGAVAVITAMHEAGIRRFIGVSALPAAPEEQKSALSRYLVHPLLHRFFGGAYDDMRRMEKLLIESDVDWTAFRPPRLTNAAATGRYRIAVETPLPLAFSVSRANLGAAILRAIDDRALFRHAVSIAD